MNDLNFTLNAGSTLGIVGESGSGKSQTAFALMGLLAANGEVEGSAMFEGKELVNLPNAELNKIRAEQISMIFQDPMTSLNPYMKIGEQLMEVLQLHKGYNKQTAFAESVKMHGCGQKCRKLKNVWACIRTNFQAVCVNG